MKNKQRTKKVKNTTLAMIMLVQFILTGCNNEDNWSPTKHMLFIDYTKSCESTDEFNEPYVRKSILSIAESMGKNDELVIYPIHAYTESASPIIEPIRLPELRGDLADAKRKKKWRKDLAKEIDRVINYQFDDRILSGTNVFAALRKANRTIKNNNNVKIHFISDMVHEMNDVSFKIDFKEIHQNDIHEIALNKAKEYCPDQSLKNIEVAVYLPGRPSGGEIEPLYHTVNSFWEEFFVMAGTSVKIRDLKA